MYLDHYQLRMMPFEIGPDPRFLWLGEKHEEAFAILQYGILESKGFIVIIGEPGTGKSTLLNATVANVGSNVRFAKINDPALNAMEFLNFAANAFEMGRGFPNKAEFLIELESFVREAGTRFKKMIFVIDEAQRLPPETLEQIRVLSNVETPGQKVMSCIFAGQPEFLDMIWKNRALSQRIFLSHIIQPLTESETGDYIGHRLKVAGRNDPLFTPAAVQEVFQLSGGNPRLTNILCDQALLIGYATHLKTIGPETVRESINNASIPLGASKNTAVAAEQSMGVGGGPPAAETAVVRTTALSQPVQTASQASARSRRTTYCVFTALILFLALAAFLYLNGGSWFGSMGPGKGTGPDGRKDQASGAAGTDDVVAPFERRILELKKDKEDADRHMHELQARFEALESEHRQLLVLTHQKNASEARFDETPKENAGKAANSEELKRFREKETRLEAAVSEKEKKLIQFEQKIAELEKMRTKERGEKNQMDVELSSRQAAIAELKNRLDAAKTAQVRLENDVQSIRSENARLQGQIQALKVQNPKSPPVPSPPQASQPLPLPGVGLEQAGGGPDPAGAIDFLIKKKTQ